MRRNFSFVLSIVVLVASLVVLAYSISSWKSAKESYRIAEESYKTSYALLILTCDSGTETGVIAITKALKHDDLGLAAESLDFLDGIAKTLKETEPPKGYSEAHSAVLIAAANLKQYVSLQRGQLKDGTAPDASVLDTYFRHLKTAEELLLKE